MNYTDIKVMLMDKYDVTEIVELLTDSGIMEEEILDCMEELIVDRLELFDFAGRYVEYDCGEDTEDDW